MPRWMNAEQSRRFYIRDRKTTATLRAILNYKASDSAMSAKPKRSPAEGSPWWTSQDDKNGSLCPAVADASGSETCSARVQIADPLHPTRGFHLPIASIQGKEATGFGLGSQASHSARFRKDRHSRCRLAHFPPHGGNHAGRDGRTSAHDPRLLASQQPSRDEQVSSGDVAEQAARAREASRCDLAWRGPIGGQNNNDPMSDPNGTVHLWDAARAHWTQTDPDSVSGIFASA